MLILFDFENIQNVHYRNIKDLIIQNFGMSDWHKSTKIGAAANRNIKQCLKSWNSNVRIYTVENHPQAADDKLVEIAARHIGNRCILISNDQPLFERIKKARLDARRGKVSRRGLDKTRTYRISFINGQLTLQNGEGPL